MTSTDKSIVAVYKTAPETVLDDIAKVMDAAGCLQALPKDSPVILKDNISWHLPFLSANTTPWQLEGVIRYLKDAGYKKLVCVQNETVVTNAFKGERLNRYVPIFKKYGIEVRYNFRPQDMNWIPYKPKSEMLVLDRIFPEGIYIPDYFLGKSVLHLPTMKCHIYTTITGAMKNAFGGLLNRRRHYTHSEIHKTLCDLLAIQKEIHTGIFSVMDGTLCGNGPGPRTMIPVEKSYMLAAADSVAIDAVEAKMLGFDPQSLEFIRVADARGLGNGTLDKIEIIGEDISNVNFCFSVGDNLASCAGDMCWFGPLKPMQKFFFHTPLVNIFIYGSHIYHDYLWWPLKGKKIAEDTYRNTRWGRLFLQYPMD